MAATIKTTIEISLRVLCIAALFLAPCAHAETDTLQHDNSGNITQRTTPLGTTTYQYDALGRLINESGPAKTQTITYDENGNRKTDGAGSYVYETTSNRMSTRLGLAVSYDAAGNLTADGTGRTFTYNEANQLYQVFQGGVLLATYEYDADGLRMSKVTTASAPQGAQTILFEYDEEGHMITELTSTGAPLHTYAWRDDTPVAQIDYQPSRRILYYETDQLNTPRAATDSTGKVIWRWESDAFGTTLPDEDPDKDGNKTTVNLRFGGWYVDVESGLFYAKNRYYSPLLRGFTQTDRLDLLRQTVNPLYAQYSVPTDLKKALNQPYVYSANNPMRFIDPLGLDSDGTYCGSCAPGAYDCLLRGGNLCKPYLCCNSEKVVECVAEAAPDTHECFECVLSARSGKVTPKSARACAICGGAAGKVAACIKNSCQESSQPCPKDSCEK